MGGRQRINMFDQPYRQHMAVAKDQGQQVRPPGVLVTETALGVGVAWRGTSGGRV
jgi:hypothetical protein